MGRRKTIADSNRALGLCIVLPLIGWSGCGGGAAAIPPVDVDIDYVVQKLLEEYDKDQSGSLSSSELAADRPLAGCLSGFRRDQGDEISAAQLKKELERVFDRRSALVSGTCTVRRNGQPLSGAEVRFVPLPVLDDVLPTSTGTTDSDGVAMIAAAADDLPSAAPQVPLMPPGLYRVEVTHASLRIPEEFNQKTVLGKEVSSETVYRGDLVVDLKL